MSQEHNTLEEMALETAQDFDRMFNLASGDLERIHDRLLVEFRIVFRLGQERMRERAAARCDTEEAASYREGEDYAARTVKHVADKIRALEVLAEIIEAVKGYVAAKGTAYYDVPKLENAMRLALKKAGLL